MIANLAIGADAFTSGGAEVQQLQAGFKFGINRSRKRIRCRGRFIFTIENDPFLTLQVSCEFGVKPDDWNLLTDKKGKCIQLPLDLIHHLAVITTGTARGILHAKTENTGFNKFFLPAINLRDILTEKVTFNLFDADN